MQATYDARAGARRTLALVSGIFLATGVVLAGIGPALPYLAGRAGQGIAALGGLFTAISGGVVLAQFGIGPAGERFGLRRVLAAGLLLMGVGTLGVTLGRSLTAMLICALLAGFGFGAVLAAGNLLVARLFAARSAAALNGVNVFFGVGSILGPTLAGLAGARLDLPQLGLWAGAGLLILLTPPLLAFAAPPPPTPHAASVPAGGSGRAAVIGLLAALLLLYVGTEVGFGGWVTVYLVNSANFSPAAAALLASGFWLALTAGRVIGAALGLRLSPMALLGAALAGLVAGAGLLLLGGSAPTIAAVLLLGLSCGPVFPTTLSVVTTAAGGGGKVGLVLALGNCGGMILPALFGVLLSRYGAPAMAGTVLAAAVAMLGLCAAATAASAGPRIAVPAAQPRECDAG